MGGEDSKFLNECFVDTGDLQTLRDCSDPRRIILGRTGVGKTALLTRLSEIEERTISIPPESLALGYISNSTILNFLQQLGVKLDIFFKLLWRHVFTVELLKYHFKICNESSKVSFFSMVSNLFRDQKHKKALAYLEDWGKSFWEETDYRIKELTTKLEADLTESIKTRIPYISLEEQNVHKISEEQRGEIIHRAQQIVNKVQIQELSQIIDLIDNVLKDPQKKYYITIDRLDENWVEDKLRYRLIRALIETVRDFRKVRHAKIVVALRIDLFNRVLQLTRDSGFQEEKYESLYLHVEWTDKRLIELIDSRIKHLILTRHNNAQVAHIDILPEKVSSQKTIEYILDRTIKRPREIISFFNECIREAVNHPLFSTEIIKTAEAEYSRKRLAALEHEWYDDYPNLKRFVAILEKRCKTFKVDEISLDDCSELCLELVIKGFSEHDSLALCANQVVDCTLSLVDFRKEMLRVFYLVGLIGLKFTTFEKTSWAHIERGISMHEVSNDTLIYVHPMFWRSIGVREK